MKHFLALIHKDTDSAYGITFPDVPGCFSAADTLEEIIPNAIEALSLWFEDQPMVEPRSMDIIFAETAEERAEGAILMAIPFILKDRIVVRANVSLDRGILRAIDREAKLRGLTRSAFIAEAAQREIEGAH